jgi:hypothetical protein
LIAETYNGNGGAVDAGGSPGKSGAAGATGASSHNATDPGGPGGAGNGGGPGSPASPITLIAHKIVNARLRARGGAGGSGGPGGRGGKGQEFHEINKPGMDDKEGTPGGPGGQGGKGGPGGKAAEITVHYVSSEGVLELLGTGGAGGPGGAGGRGGGGGRMQPGTGGHSTMEGAKGPHGAAGAAGAAVAPDQRKHDADAWWSIASAALGTASSRWADYRVRVGEYRFRSYSPAGSPIIASRGIKFPVLFLAMDNRAQALHEFDVALRLNAKHSQAQQLRERLLAGLTPLGLAYNCDIIPDFPTFEHVVTDYHGMIKNLFDNAFHLLLQAEEKGDKVQWVAADVEHIKGMQTVLQFEEAGAKAKVQEVATQQAQVQSRLDKIAADLGAIAKERLERRMNFPPGSDGNFLGTIAVVAGAIAAIAATIASAGAAVGAVAAAAGLMVNAANAAEKYGDGTLLDWFDMSDPLRPKPREEAKAAIGGIQDLVKKTKDFIDKAQAVKELFEAEVEGDDLASAEKELLVQRVQASFDMSIVQLRKAQAEMELAAVKAKQQVQQEDIQRFNALKQGWENQIAELAKIARAIIRQTQGYIDVISKYIFLARRALDLATFSNDSAKFTFTLGHVHPDLFEETFERLARGDDSTVIELLGKHLDGWGSVPELVSVRDRYEQYTGNLHEDRRFWSITDPETLDSLRKYGTASIAALLEDFPEDQPELKVERVHAALVGATADTPLVTIEVEHPGDASNRHAGKVVEIKAPARRTTVSATLAPLDVEALDLEGSKQSFWWRSPATRWRISVEPLSAKNSKLDLKNLSALQFAILYRYYRPRR